MATWHQSRNRAGMVALYSPPARGYRVVVDKPNALAYGVEFTRKRDAARLARKTGGCIVAAVRRAAH